MSNLNITKQYVYLSVGIAIILISIVIVFLMPFHKVRDAELRYVDATNLDSVIHVNDIWIQPIIYQHIPDLRSENKETKLQVFLDIMVPSVLLAQKQIEEKRDSIILCDQKLKNGEASLSDSTFLHDVFKEFNYDSVQYIVNSLHHHPISITLAQAAIESGWGTSRFCIEANNIFGIWSYNPKEKRIKANTTRVGRGVYLRSYDSVAESVYDYLVTISRARAYRKFRDARIKSQNPYKLIWYLSNYSEKRYEYVRMLRNIIEYNHLTRYDSCSLIQYNTE